MLVGFWNLHRKIVAHVYTLWLEMASLSKMWSMFLLIIGVFGKDVNVAGTNLEGFVVLFALIAVVYTFLVSAGMLSQPPAWLGWLVDAQTRSMLVAILVFGIIVWFITKEERPLDQRKPVHETLKDLFGGTLK